MMGGYDLKATAKAGVESGWPRRSESVLVLFRFGFGSGGVVWFGLCGSAIGSYGGGLRSRTMPPLLPAKHILTFTFL